jgi:ribose 5-phosphate isomerase A
MPMEATSDALGKAAAAEVRSGMLVGLGSGRTAARAIRALADRVRAEKLDIDCVCTSVETENLARELGLPTVQFSDVNEVDYLFDGASEVDHKLRMLKGQHGAITRQRLVAEVAARRVYLAEVDKLVQRLGEKTPLTVTIIPFGISSIRERMRHMGLMGVVRRNMEGEVFLTDGGGVVIDLRLPPDRDVHQLAEELDRVVGVVDHGLFLDEADEVFVGYPTGEIKRMVRED